MQNAQAPVPDTDVPTDKVKAVLRPFDDRQRLLRLVKTMSEEIQRLTEENAQLHAAIKIYREVARRRQNESA
jgi:hypothetical protein